MIIQILFFLFSAIALGAAVAVVTSRNLFHSALWLALSFVGMACLYVLLEAPFLAAVQILVYVGAICVLILFAIMLTRRLMAKDLVQRNAQWGLSLLVALLLFATLAFIIARVDWPVTQAAPPADAIPQLGEELMSTYLLPFEVASVLLLVALVGAVMIARER